MIWEIVRAIALVLIIEGIMPFLSPRQLRRTLFMAAQLPERTLRLIGLISMLIGLAILYAVRLVV